MARSRTESRLVRRFAIAGAEGGVASPADQGRAHQRLLVEEPLEIRVDGTTVATTMRTPGHDFELAVGWCHAEGLLDGVELRGIRYCATGSAVDAGFNVVTVETSGRGRPVEPRLNPMTSSCGICGTDTVDRLLERLDRLPVGAPLSAEVLSSVTEWVAADQELFRSTGGSTSADSGAPTG
ncbi:MAG TPA: formate dehydrogenase accessory sulfurtransferase FdhD, partial [Microthrixaceae bacterium]|nr:formate dehydrogenase accessory sulfurtransferase FdhD [Microthrixaceae bacterium]